MADSKGKLSELDKKAVWAWFDHHWSIGRSCPISGGNSWTVADHLVAPPVVDAAGKVQSGGGSYPQVMMVCTECGYTRYFNAVLVGVVDPDAEPPGGRRR